MLKKTLILSRDLSRSALFESAYFSRVILIFLRYAYTFAWSHKVERDATPGRVDLSRDLPLDRSGMQSICLFCLTEVIYLHSTSSSASSMTSRRVIIKFYIIFCISVEISTREFDKSQIFSRYKHAVASMRDLSLDISDVACFLGAILHDCWNNNIIILNGMHLRVQKCISKILTRIHYFYAWINRILIACLFKRFLRIGL